MTCFSSVQSYKMSLLTVTLFMFFVLAEILSGSAHMTPILRHKGSWFLSQVSDDSETNQVNYSYHQYYCQGFDDNKIGRDDFSYHQYYYQGSDDNRNSQRNYSLHWYNRQGFKNKRTCIRGCSLQSEPEATVPQLKRKG
ncbi:uncharacterized protein LOC133524817 isoform X2 [Cydia pomonella]|uniref:uncharacterized protein LOC133524817 isoform X2 n=1 Tax=Cydia pomonella TaxID=82600 RepID=UPI002ADD656E|nr:uncharacterized protein LOC133524817 isoform X2 [Cydia pomonella]